MCASSVNLWLQLSLGGAPVQSDAIQENIHAGIDLNLCCCCVGLDHSKNCYVHQVGYIFTSMCVCVRTGGCMCVCVGKIT